MESLFEKLGDYLCDDGNTIHRWSELEDLLNVFEGGKVPSNDIHLAVFAILQADSHNTNSCFNKAYDLASDLRDNIEKVAVRLSKKLPKQFCSALELEIQSHRTSQLELADLKKESNSEILAKRDWNFFVLRENQTYKLYAFNYLCPSAALTKELSPVEVTFSISDGFYPMCNDIAEKLRFDYWLENMNVKDSDKGNKAANKSWLGSIFN